MNNQRLPIVVSTWFILHGIKHIIFSLYLIWVLNTQVIKLVLHFLVIIAIFCHQIFCPILLKLVSFSVLYSLHLWGNLFKLMIYCLDLIASFRSSTIDCYSFLECHTDIFYIWSMHSNIFTIFCWNEWVLIAFLLLVPLL